jgi:ATP-binding cassette, subfamily F, member 3
VRFRLFIVSKNDYFLLVSSSQNLLQISGASKSFGLQSLFENASFSINEGEHVGVIGPNGAGKTTLFKILIGEQEFDSGVIIKSRALRLGYLSQHDQWRAEETGLSYLEKVSTLPLWQVKLFGKDLQIDEEILAKPLLSLSGGYRMRIKLMGLLGAEPNLMLLDEPTNYLDLETTLLLERFLQNYEGAFLLISHDREVLRRTTDHTLEVEGGEIIKYSGHIDDYFEQKELLRTQLAAQAQNQEAKRKSVMDFVNRFGAQATKARQAQSRLKSLQKMESINLKPIPVRSVIQIPEPPHIGKSVLKLEKVTFGYQDKKVLQNISLEIKKGDHVAVVGFNGEGKSTLLKGIAGLIVPLDGQRILGHQVEIAIFNQHVTEVLNPEHTVYDSLAEAAAKDVMAQEIRNMAGALLFSSDHIQKKIKVLSGGEKSRVALGRILLQKVPCLLLDEPTNHLDFETVEALTQSLEVYAGTLIVVSHDRSFIRRVGTKILEVSKGQVLLYPGTYDEYVWRLQNFLSKQEEPEAILPVKSSENVEVSSSASKKKHRDIQREQKQLEKKIAKLEKQMVEINEQNIKLNEEIAASTGPSQLLSDCIALLAKNTLELEEIETQWISASEDLANLMSNA